MSSAPDRRSLVKWAAVAGIVAPILFTILYLVLGAVTPGYNAYSQTISELGQVGQQYAVIQDANFVITGLLIIGFESSLRASIPRSRTFNLGGVLLLVYPIAFVLVGAVIPLPSPLHVPTGSIGFFLTLVGMIIISWPMRKQASWQRFGYFTLIAGILSVVGFFVYGFLQSQNIATSWLGLAQRLDLAPYFVWIEIVAIKLVSATRKHTNPVITK